MALLCLFITTTLSQPLLAANPQPAPIKTSVIMPIATGAAKIIYNEVISGITANPELDVSTIAISSNEDIVNIEKKIKANNSKLIISVGNRSYKLAKELTTDALIVAGLVMANLGAPTSFSPSL